MKCLVILLFIGKILFVIHGVIYLFWPETANITYDLFWSKDYHEELTVLFYVHELSAILKEIIFDFVLFVMARKVSMRFSKAIIVFFFCDAIQFAFYIIDRNTSYFDNFILYLYAICILIIIFIPNKKTAIVKNF